MEKRETIQDRAIDSVAKMALSSQLDEVEELNVNIDSTPLKVVSGELESVEILGEGLVMHEDLRMKELEVQTGKISIDPLRAVIGQIEMEEPTNARVRVILAETDINQAFDSDYIRDKLQNLPVTVEGKPMTLDVRNVDFSLPGDGKIRLNSKVFLQETGETKEVVFTAVPQVRADGSGAFLTDICYGEGKELSPELTAALLQNAEDLLNLHNFEISGMSVQLRGLKVEVGQIELEAQACIEEIPKG